MRKTIALAVLLCCCLNISYSSNNPIIAEHILNEKLTTLDAQVDLRVTDLAQKKIQEYLSYKKGAEKLITKSKLYFPVFEKQLRKYNIPEEFKYLPVIESNLEVNIKSKAGAVGLWQFMKPTGQSFGLQIGAEVDERMNVEKSTEAAAQYLLQLYHEFQDWTLVLVAYNAGAGNIRKAIRKSGKKGYWDVYGYLPRETRSYLPKFTAAAYLMNFHQDHDIYAIAPDKDLVDVISATVFHEIDFEAIAKTSNTSVELIEALNAQYIKGFIPSNLGKYSLKLPAHNMDMFVKYNASVRIENSSIPVHMLKKEVKLAKILRKVKLLNSNGKRSELAFNKQHINKEYQLIKLTKKETLQSVAYKTGLSLDELLALNNLDGSSDKTIDKYIKVPTRLD